MSGSHSRNSIAKTSSSRPSREDDAGKTCPIRLEWVKYARADTERVQQQGWLREG